MSPARDGRRGLPFGSMTNDPDRLVVREKDTMSTELEHRAKVSPAYPYTPFPDEAIEQSAPDPKTGKQRLVVLER